LLGLFLVTVFQHLLYFGLQIAALGGEPSLVKLEFGLSCGHFCLLQFQAVKVVYFSLEGLLPGDQGAVLLTVAFVVVLELLDELALGLDLLDVVLPLPELAELSRGEGGSARPADGH
jgi:hypothetical protein